MAQIIAGLDVGSRSIRLARLKVGFKTVELEKLVSVEAGEEAWAAIREGVKGADQVFTTLPGDQLAIRQLEFPRAASKRLEQILPIELDGEIPFDVDEMVFGHRITNQGSERIDVLAVAVKRTLIEETLAKLGEVGINPREIAPAPIILAELAKQTAPQETVAVIDVGHSRTDIAIVERGEFKQARTSSYAAADITRELAKAFGVPEETAEEWKRSAKYLVLGDLEHLADEQRRAVDAVRSATDQLVREVRQTLAAHSLKGGESVSHLVLCGGGSRLRGLGEYLSSELGVPVELFTAPDSLKGSEQQDLVSGATAVAIALAGATPRNERINLRTGDLAFEGEANIGRGLLLYALAAVFFIMIAWGYSAYAKHTALEVEREAQFQQLKGMTKRLLGQELQSFDALKTLMTQAAEKQASVSPIPELDAFDVVEQISKRIPTEINHEIDSLDIRSGRVQLKGRVDQRQEADAIQEALSEWNDCFTKVPVPRTTPAVRDKRLQYTMDIESRCP